MPTYPLITVDAFTSTPLAGNPCAVVFNAGSLTEAQMLAIAREMNLSETAFVLPSERATVRARYFTPAEEIPMAGHPTLATTRALLDRGELALDGEGAFTLELKAGVLRVEVAGEGDNAIITMTQRAPQFLTTHDPAVVMSIFGLAPDDALLGVPIQTVSTGTPQLMIAVRDHDALRRAVLNPAAYTAYRAQSDFFSPHLFALGGATPQGDTFARHFGTPPDTSEDPFTGSATGGMAAFLWHHGLMEQPRFVAEQGHWMRRPGQGVVERVGTREHIEGVRVGGPAVVVMRGELHI